jgi:hypothetical protein
VGKGIFCAGVPNLFLRGVGKRVPTRGNPYYDGGVAAYFWSPLYGNGYFTGYDEPFNLAKAKRWAQETRSGVLIGREYRGEALLDQGHVAILLPSGYVLQSNVGDGLNWKWTIEESHAGGFYTRMVHPTNWIDYEGDEFANLGIGFDENPKPEPTVPDTHPLPDPIPEDESPPEPEKEEEIVNRPKRRGKTRQEMEKCQCAGGKGAEPMEKPGDRSRLRRTVEDHEDRLDELDGVFAELAASVRTLGEHGTRPTPFPPTKTPKKEKPNKAYVAACSPLVVAATSYLTTGTVSEAELTLALTSLVAGFGVYITSNRG